MHRYIGYAFVNFFVTGTWHYIGMTRYIILYIPKRQCFQLYGQFHFLYVLLISVLCKKLFLLHGITMKLLYNLRKM